MIFGLFKRKTEIEKLEAKHLKLVKKGETLLAKNPNLSNKVMIEADKVEQRIEILKLIQNNKT